MSSGSRHLEQHDDALVEAVRAGILAAKARAGSFRALERESGISYKTLQRFAEGSGRMYGDNWREAVRQFHVEPSQTGASIAAAEGRRLVAALQSHAAHLLNRATAQDDEDGIERWTDALSELASLDVTDVEAVGAAARAMGRGDLVAPARPQPAGGDTPAERAAYARAKLEAALLLLDTLPAVRRFVHEALGALAAPTAPLPAPVVEDAERALIDRPSADAPAAK